MKLGQCPPRAFSSVQRITPGALRASAVTTHNIRPSTISCFPPFYSFVSYPNISCGTCNPTSLSKLSNLLASHFTSFKDKSHCTHWFYSPVLFLQRLIQSSLSSSTTKHPCLYATTTGPFFLCLSPLSEDSFKNSRFSRCQS